MSEKDQKNLTEMTDKERLLKAMDEFGDGYFEPIDREKFDDPELADAFNSMLHRQSDRNNKYLVRINDTQSRVADTSCLKAMFEQITAQEEAIKMIQNVKFDITPDSRPVAETNQELLALAAQVKNTIRPCSEDIEEALKLYEQLEVPDNESWSETENNEQYIILRQLQKSIQRASDKLDSMERRIYSIDENARSLFEIIDRSMSIGDNFINGVDFLTKSYKNLSIQCIELGRHLYRISRDIDNARNDSYRYNSYPTLLDRLKVFEVDHITLAWRVYNHILEYETLKITHVNNPESCKFGLWLKNTKDPAYADSDEFKNLSVMHRAFHDRAVECYLAKQESNTVLALDKFANTMDALEGLIGALGAFREYVMAKGYTEETELWEYKGY